MAGQDYAEVSFEVWQQMATGWDRERSWMWDVSRPVGEWMVEALAPQPGETVLEIACGTGETGFLAGKALGPEGKLIQTDFAPKMVEAARAGAARLELQNVEHRVLDAQRMDLPDAGVDGVLCRWGYMLMADTDAALAETRRVLRDGGRLALSVWGQPGDNPWASLPGLALMEHTGAPPPDPDAPGIFAMGDRGRTRTLLADAGFEVVRMEDVQVRWRFPDADAFWRFVMELAGGLALVLRAMPEEDRQAVRVLSEQKLAAYRSDDGSYVIPGVAQNTLAR